LALYKGHGKIGEAQKPFRRASPIVPEIACFVVLTGNGNIFNTR
jgi:hypothetical protein